MWTTSNNRVLSSIRNALLYRKTPFAMRRYFSADNTEATSSLSPSLVQYMQTVFQQRLSDKLQLPLTEPDVIDMSKVLMQTLLDHGGKDLDNRLFEQRGTMLSKVLAYLTEEEVQASLRTSSTPLDVDYLLTKYESRIKENEQVFRTILSHHYTITQHPWQDTASNLTSLESYSSAAAMMGKKVWVKESNTWMADFAVSFFRFGGARKHHIKFHQLLDQVKEKGKDIERYFPFAKDLLQGDPATGQDKKIRLLDVGSCYNPLARSPQASFLDVTAIDLHPADSSVFPCDFLNVEVGPKDSTMEFRTDEFGRQVLSKLPAESFDAITMSLVLNYLPTPRQREVMVEKARQLLVSPDPQSSQPHYKGLLLIVEKESIFNRIKDFHNQSIVLQENTLHAEWKQAMQQMGFEFVKYNLLHTNDTHRAHTFAFAKAASIPDLKEQNNSDQAATRRRLWIKQDFDAKTYDAASVTSSTAEVKKSTKTKITSFNSFYDPIGIIGGGLGGSALALALQQRGIPFYLFEKDSSFAARRQGYALTMQQGNIALRELNIQEEVLRAGAISMAHYSFDQNGDVIGAYGVKELPAAEADDLKALSRHNIHIPRQTLRELIVNKIEPKHIRWNSKLSNMEKLSGSSSNKDANGVKLHFADGTEENVSVVIGADGIFSQVRKLALQEQHSKFNSMEYLQLMVVLGISNIPSKSQSDANYLCQRQWLDGSNRIFTMPFDRTKTMWQMSFPMTEQAALELSSLTQHHQADRSAAMVGRLLKEEAMRRCGHWPKALLDILENTNDEDVSGHPVYDREPTLSFMQRKLAMAEVDQDSLLSRVTLLGDAAHPMSPFKGQGANQALLDALYLSRSLVSSEIGRAGRRSISETLNDFEDEMMTRAKSKVFKSREAAVYLHHPSALTKANITRAKASEQYLQQMEDQDVVVK